MSLEAYFIPYIKTNSIWTICISAKFKITAFRTSSQDVGVGIQHCASSHSQRKDSNNLKTNNQNWQKIELYGSPTTKEIKKKQPSRLVGGAEMGSRAQKTWDKVAAGRPSEVVDCGVGWGKLQLAGQTAAGGPGDRPCNPQFQGGEIKPQTTDWKHLCGLRQQQEKLPASKESLLERPTGA